MPRLFTADGQLAPGIALALVVIDDQEEVVQAFCLERKVELMGFGGAPRATAVARHHIDAIAYLLAAEGYAVIDCLVPQGRAEQLAKPLTKAGFERDDPSFAHFTRGL